MFPGIYPGVTYSKLLDSDHREHTPMDYRLSNEQYVEA